MYEAQPEVWRCPKHGLVQTILNVLTADNRKRHFCFECLVDAIVAAGIMEVTEETTAKADIIVGEG